MAPLSDECWAAHGVPYESYMVAIVGPVRPDGSASLLVRFPADACEDNRLHTHPVSTRRIRVLDGAGWFILVSRGRVEARALHPGAQVTMDAGRLHTFLAGPDGMLVESVHAPFVELDDPRALCYPLVERFQIPAELPSLTRPSVMWSRAAVSDLGLQSGRRPSTGSAGFSMYTEFEESPGQFGLREQPLEAR